MDNNLKGLDTQTAEKLLQEFGKNELIASHKVTIWERIFDQIKNPLIFVLIIVVIASIILREYSDAIIIGIVVIFNTVIGIFYESKADDAIEALKQKLTQKSRVYRDGKVINIDSALLVPGDIVLLQAGDKVPADGKVIESSNLQVDESQLSGESFPVIKNNKDKNLFMGSIVTTGKAEFEVYKTGMSSELGEITKYISEKGRDKTPLERKFKTLTNIILIVVATIGVSIIALGYFLSRNLFEIIETSIALSLSTIPEGLPVVVTLTLSIGVFRMSQKNAVLRNLASVSTLSEVDVICTDKTGTITEGKVVLDEIDQYPHSLPKVSELTPLEMAMLCNDAHNDFGDLLDLAILNFGKSKEINLKTLKHNFPRIAEIPFDSSYMYQATLHKTGDKNLLIVKGAADVLRDKCKHNQEIINYIKERNSHFGNIGKRIILVGAKKISASEIDNNDIDNLEFQGLLVFSDPLRSDIHDAIERSKKSEIQTIMITGDHQSTARNIAMNAGISNGHASDLLIGKDIDGMSTSELAAIIDQINVIARADPIDKVKVIDAIRERGAIIAMTGDGVNDAPALVKADIGIAMGKNGTDAARESADMVLVDDKYSTIINGIEQARLVFENLRKTSSYLFSTSFGEILVISSSIALALPIPIIAAQILWLNLITDGFLDVAIATEKNHGDLLRFNKKRYKSGIIDRLMVVRILLLGGVMGISSILFFNYMLKANDLIYAQTATFALLAVFQWINALNARSQDLSLFQIGVFSNKFVLGALALVILLGLFAIYTPYMNDLLHTVPLRTNDWLIIIAIGSSILVVEEFRKIIFQIFSKK